ncbi:MAG: hypothetical protein Q7V56_01475 [Gammaproteobacteria bacterium]|nr:hypothetical protein [Gammaproteobacteria bacterium]
MRGDNQRNLFPAPTHQQHSRSIVFPKNVGNNAFQETFHLLHRSESNQFKSHLARHHLDFLPSEKPHGFANFFWNNNLALGETVTAVMMIPINTSVRLIVEQIQLVAVSILFGSVAKCKEQVGIVEQPAHPARTPECTTPDWP